MTREKEPIWEKVMRLLLDIEQRMATKDDIKQIRSEMATKADLLDYATKNDLDSAKEEILEAFRPVEKAVDRNSEIIVNHEQRLVALESNKRTAVK